VKQGLVVVVVVRETSSESRDESIRGIQLTTKPPNDTFRSAADTNFPLRFSQVKLQL
jgi:hypothetical protein